MSSIKILVLECNEFSISKIVDILKKNNFIVRICKNNEEFFESIYNNLYDLYLINIEESLTQRLQLIKLLEEYKDITIKMVVTSIKDIVKQSFLSGCDECVIKNIDDTEIILRIKALIRRQFLIYKDSIFLTNSIEYEIFNKRILMNKKEISLGNKAILILDYLLKFRGNFVSVENLEKGVYPANSNSKSGVIRYHIHKIRQFVGNDLITSHRAYGYKINI